MSLVVSYKEQREQAHLAGRSVAEARKMYTPVLNIPDKAQAKLNGKEVKRKLEAETILDDGDELYFYEKVRNRKLILIGALMGALALTGGMFAYTYTTASATISAVAKSDFAKVEPYETLEFTTKVFGHYRGNIPSGRLFKITPDADYTGDLSAKVYLTNADELGLAYKHLNMKFELLDANGVTVNVDWRNEYEQAHRHFEEWCGVFDAASDAFNSANNTFVQAKNDYV
ncbi:MAG: hypothetical protein QMC90_02290, partial [Dehalococcoidales bacterium]|nr:hypothetical protein [Dehalococcoidales bacterium]